MNTPTNTAPRIALPDAALPAVLREWKEISNWLETAKKKEKDLRDQICAAFFPKPTEGTNRVMTSIDGNEVELVIDHRINRKLDETVLDTVMLSLPEDSPYRQPGVLVAFKPTLVLKNFRTLPDDQRRIFSAALTETPGAPALEVNGLLEAVAEIHREIISISGSASSRNLAIKPKQSAAGGPPASALYAGKSLPKKQSAASKALTAVKGSIKKKR